MLAPPPWYSIIDFSAFPKPMLKLSRAIDSKLRVCRLGLHLFQTKMAARPITQQCWLAVLTLL